MLILTRRTGESIQIGDNVQVRVLSIRGNSIRLGFTAPRSVHILRDNAVARDKRPQVERFTAPGAWASYLINGDASGISDADKKAATEWITSLGLGPPLSCEGAGFRKVHDALAFWPEAADCETYVFLPSK